VSTGLLANPAATRAGRWLRSPLGTVSVAMLVVAAVNLGWATTSTPAAAFGLVVAVLTAGAVVVKHVLRIGRRPVFNPAALALVAADLIGVRAQSWWGASAAPVYLGVPVLIIAVLFVADRANRLPAT
jgi:hypothetical protein